MPNTEGSWTQSSPNTDLQIFLGADEIRNTSGAPVLTLNASGDLSQNVAASGSAVFVISALEFIRTGVYATPGATQQQFGTAAAQPGPSTVAGTSDPLALKAGYPPIPSNQMATLGNFATGPIQKGFQVNSIDVIYLISGAALTTHVVGLTRTVFVNNVAAAVTNSIVKAANGLQTAVQANPYVTNIPNPAAAMIVTPDTELIIELDVTTAAGTYRLYGFVLHCSYNLN